MSPQAVYTLGGGRLADCHPPWRPPSYAMSLEYYVPGDGPAALLDMLSGAIAAAGTDAFNSHFLVIIEKVIRADQCMIFSYRNDRPECYLSYNERHKSSADNLAQQYLRGGFLDDPLLAEVADVRASGRTKVIDIDELRPRMGSDYLSAFYVKREIGDKIAVLASDRHDVIGISFYRYVENGRFHRSEPSVRHAFWDMLAKLVLLHFSGRRDADVTSPLNSLSAREKSICEAMLRGLTADAIAWEMNLSPSTVKTYRRRAYEKLGVNSRSALFELCHRG